MADKWSNLYWGDANIYQPGDEFLSTYRQKHELKTSYMTTIQAGDVVELEEGIWSVMGVVIGFSTYPQVGRIMAMEFDDGVGDMDLLTQGHQIKKVTRGGKPVQKVTRGGKPVQKVRE